MSISEISWQALLVFFLIFKLIAICWALRGGTLNAFSKIIFQLVIVLSTYGKMEDPRAVISGMN